MENKFEQFFLDPRDRKQLLYEALRKSFVEKVPDKSVCEIYQIKFNTFRSLKRDFVKAVNSDQEPARLFFAESKTGKREKKEPELVEKIITLRMENLSVPEIKAILSSQNIHVSFWKIDNILKAHNLPALPRRTQKSKQQIKLPTEFKAPEASALEFPFSDRFESINGSIFLFYPVLKTIQIQHLVNDAGYPQTGQIDRLSAILSFLALKLINTKRLSHSNEYNLDRGLGLFAKLNVLPKDAWFASYSYRVTREMNKRFLVALNREVEKFYPGSGDFNLDFTTIPHWGDDSVLEHNWSTKRRGSLKSILALLVQEQNSKFIKYGDAEIKQANQADAVLEFIDFYKTDNAKINCLIFDSKFTTYGHLNKLNKDNIKFLTLRRRSKKMVEALEHIDKDKWQRVRLNKNFRRKYRNLLVYESKTTLDDYQGELRQIVIKNNGREHPAFLITNDFDISIEQAVLKYAKRWLVEQVIAEQIDFYHLNRLNSSIVVKVDFDLTMSILADTVYKLFCKQIPGFENSKSETIYRLFIKNYTRFQITEDEKTIEITLNKKVNLPLLSETDWLEKETIMPWLDDYDLKFKISSTL